jgi:hypothetical protein
LVQRTKLQHDDLLPRAPDVAAWGGHGVGFAQVRRDAAAVYGETAARRARLAAARRRADKIKEGKQHMRGQGCGSAHVESAM